IGVFQSTDGGNTWASFNGANLPLGVPVYDIQQNNNGTIFIGTHGRGAYKLPSQPSHPAFFTGEASLGGGWYYLAFSDGALFGYYTYNWFPWLYHQDMGFEYFADAQNSAHGAFLYDLILGQWFYTDPANFSYLYNFGAGAWYFYSQATADHYTSNPRWFLNMSTKVWIHSP
ncbi:MAG TPA: hypothetical protein VEF03_13475, partial [Candidatus Binataceae bacterium]|nr:hypothetical protein [Candidatus Binataceae bacterium]